MRKVVHERAAFFVGKENYVSTYHCRKAERGADYRRHAWRETEKERIY